MCISIHIYIYICIYYSDLSWYIPYASIFVDGVPKLSSSGSAPPAADRPWVAPPAGPAGPAGPAPGRDGRRPGWSRPRSPSNGPGEAARKWVSQATFKWGCWKKVDFSQRPKKNKIDCGFFSFLSTRCEIHWNSCSPPISAGFLRSS